MARQALHPGLLACAGLFACGLLVVVSPADPAVASGQVCTAVVIDDQNGGAPTQQAAQVQSGATDLAILQAAGDSFAQNDAGLVCAIDGYPANGVQNCLNTANGLFYYWSYWEGDPTTNTWTYAKVGPATHTVAAGQAYVEGWRYQNPGPDSPSAPKPSVTPAAAFATACPAASSVPASGAASGGGGSVGSGNAGGAPPASGGPGTSSVVPASPTNTPTTGPGSGGTAPTPNSVAGAPGSPATPGATTTTRERTAGPSQRHGGGATSASATSKSGDARHSNSKPKTSTGKAALAGAAVHHGSGGGNPALPIVMVAVVIGLLGAVAWFRWRHRPGEE